MAITNLTIERAKDEIVFALKKQAFDARLLASFSRTKEPPKKALPAENRNLESAINDMIERFPQTLDYLAK